MKNIDDMTSDELKARCRALARHAWQLEVIIDETGRLMNDSTRWEEDPKVARRFQEWRDKLALLEK